MAPSPMKTPGKASGPKKVYLFNCPYKEKASAKKAGAKWDASAGCWYVLSSQNLEAFNKWHPNENKYLVCSYDEKDDAKRAGAKWDATCKQWYIAANQDESRFARWLPSSAGNRATKATKLIKGKKSEIKTTKTPTKLSTKSQLATIPRINGDMTVAQLQTECKARDPSIKGITTKRKDWFLEHLKVGTPWISAEVPYLDYEPESPPRKRNKS